MSTSCAFYYDDITVTSFINIKYGNVAVEDAPSHGILAKYTHAL